MFKVIRDMHFSYGHRLLNYDGKCAHIHGHTARVQIEIKSEKLNSQKMVVDFFDINKTIEAWINENLDHRLILSKEDPLVSVLKEFGEPVVVIEENPTAESFAKLIFNEAKKMKLNVSKVVFWENAENAAIFEG